MVIDVSAMLVAAKKSVQNASNCRVRPFKLGSYWKAGAADSPTTTFLVPAAAPLNISHCDSKGRAAYTGRALRLGDRLARRLQAVST